jgi:2-polyprenyl-3-methyl-5-hydroxy-6-metoxy-1,4-benzoquinol methylase
MDTPASDRHVSNNPVMASCRLCGSDDCKTVAHQQYNGLNYHIVKCKHCSLLYVRETYACISPDYVDLTEEDIDAARLFSQGKHKERAFRQCLQLVKLYSQVGTQSDASLLDVGCGTGGWLTYASSKYRCYGFDASLAQSSYARKSFPEVRCATSLSEYLLQLDHPPSGFDLITLWDVLEHIRQPVPFLAELGGYLPPTGLLFVAVPAATPMLLKNRFASLWPGFTWHPHEHAAYYSPQTLVRLCDKAGLEVLRIEAVKAYGRSLSLFEIFRRIGFWITSSNPYLSLQICCICTRKE